MSPLRLSLSLIALSVTILALGCTSRRSGGGFPDASVPTDGATDSATMTDSATPFDSGTTTMDSGTPVDTGTADSGTTDSGVTDSGVTDSGLTVGDSALLGDGGYCVTGMIECPAGQMCCEVLPGTGIGTCMATCP